MRRWSVVTYWVVRFWWQGLPPVSGVQAPTLITVSQPTTTPPPPDEATTTPPPPDEATKSGGGGLDDGEIAGVVIGSLAGTARLQCVPAFPLLATREASIAQRLGSRWRSLFGFGFGVWGMGHGLRVLAQAGRVGRQR